MAALGLGAFFTGLGEGYDAQNREMRAQAKEKREQEMYGIQKQNAELELKAKKDEQAYRDDLKNNMADLVNMSKPQQIQDPATGQMIEKPGLDPVSLQLAARDRLQEINFKYGKIDLQQLKAAREFGKQIEQEGAIEAIRYAMTNPNDQAGIRKIFNEKGKIKLGDDIQIGLQDGLFGPTVVGFRVGPKGEKIQVFDGFRDIIMPSMSADAYASLMGNMKITEAKEKGDTFRTGLQTGSAERIAASNQANQRAIKGMELGKGETDAFNDMLKTRFTGIFRNPINQMEADRNKVIEAEIGMLGRQYMRAGADAQTALNLAQNEVFKKFNVNTESLIQPKK